MVELGRAVVVIMDSLGVGAAPDAADYGDAGADTLGHTAVTVGGLDLPNLAAAGLGNLHPDTAGVAPSPQPTMAYGRMAEASAGKDSTTGHWEMAGVITAVPQATFTEEGFPPELVSAVERDSGHRFIGNFAASGTTIIEELGPEHARTGALILYTSADSVFQIAAHKDVVPLEELYRVCRIARQHCDPYHIGRVIARPFEGRPGHFLRTYERQDFSMKPPAATVLDHAQAAGLHTFGVGKIEDLFAGRGLGGSVHTAGDADGMRRTIEALADPRRGIVMTNLVDLDMTYGHRENPAGYADGLALIDHHLPALVSALGRGDLLFLSADHGNDPTDGSTDHTREYVPLLVAGRACAGVELGTRSQFCDIAATIAEGFGLPSPDRGHSFWMEVAG
jgi:phosphopentomutase